MKCERIAPPLRPSAASEAHQWLATAIRRIRAGTPREPHAAKPFFTTLASMFFTARYLTQGC